MSSSFLQAAAWRDADRTGRRAAAAAAAQHTNALEQMRGRDNVALDALLAGTACAVRKGDPVSMEVQAEVLHDLLGVAHHSRHREILAVLPSLGHPDTASSLRGALEAALRDGFAADADDGEAAGWFASALREIGDAAALGVLVDFAVCDRLDFAHACRQALGAWEEASVGERPLAVAREFRVRLRDGQLVARALPGSGPTGAAKPHDDRRPPRSRDVAGGGYALFGPHRVEDEEDPFGDSPPGMF